MEYETHTATYYIDNLRLSKFITDLDEDLSKGVVPFLKLKILRRTLTNVFFIDEEKASNLLYTLDSWEKETSSLNSLKETLEMLNNLMVFDYILYGSFVVNKEGDINWDIDISILLPN